MCKPHTDVIRIFPHWPIWFTFCEMLLQIFLTPLYYTICQSFSFLYFAIHTCCHVWTKVFKFYFIYFFPFVKKDLSSFLGLFPFLLCNVQLLLFLGCARNCKRYHFLLFVDLHTYENVFLSTQHLNFKVIFTIFLELLTCCKKSLD